MHIDVFTGILAKLNTDDTLMDWGITFFRARSIKPADLPCGTLLGNSEKSSTRAGYNASKVRDNAPMTQVDLWAHSGSESFPCSGEDLDLVANRVDEVLLDSTSPVTGTKGWEKTTESQQLEDDTGIWHVALRYSFRYSVIDT